MKGLEFEKLMVRILYKKGYWVHRISPAFDGSQPFDVIALLHGKVVAIDCKVVSSKGPRFPLDRVEVNQLSAMEALNKKFNCFLLGFLVYYQAIIYFISFEEIKKALYEHEKSIVLSDDKIFHRVTDKD